MSHVRPARFFASSGLAVLFVALLAVAPATAAVWVASADLDPSNSFTAEITIDDGTGIVQFVLSGPDTQWFALGLGGTSMSETYSIVTTPTPAVEERELGNHNAGTVLTPSITTESHVVNAGTSTFTLTRVLDPGTGAYVFDMADVEGGVPIPVIWGVGQGAPFQYHGNSNRGAADVQFEGDATPVHHEVVSQSFGATKMAFRRVR
jgi:hypothetical protein